MYRFNKLSPRKHSNRILIKRIFYAVIAVLITFTIYSKFTTDSVSLEQSTSVGQSGTSETGNLDNLKDVDGLQQQQQGEQNVQDVQDVVAVAGNDDGEGKGKVYKV
ncbi:hypothetical protein PP707_07870, partial [Acetobacter pasteurianus]|nr:hypothetical protein [Acetobacter pasteurianus]